MGFLQHLSQFFFSIEHVKKGKSKAIQMPFLLLRTKIVNKL